MLQALLSVPIEFILALRAAFWYHCPPEGLDRPRLAGDRPEHLVGSRRGSHDRARSFGRTGLHGTR